MKRHTGSMKEEEEDNFDIALLLFTTGFNFVHISFVFYAGVVHVMSGNNSFFPGWMSILFSLLNMVEVTALLIFLIELENKAS